MDYDFLNDSTYYDSEKQEYKYKSKVFGYGHWGYLDCNALRITNVTGSDSGANVTISNSGSQLVEQFPDYQEVPALIYIGKKK